MNGRPIVRVCDKTTHGGTVTEGFSCYDVLGRAAAGMGHMVTCPRCEGAFPIAEGVATFAIDDSFVAVDGMKTSCGASLVASQTFAVVYLDPGGIVSASIDRSASTESSLTDQALSEHRLSNEHQRTGCDHPDTAIQLAEYIVRPLPRGNVEHHAKEIHNCDRKGT